MRSLNSGSEFTANYSVMMKALGIAVLGESASDICKDCGEASIAGGVELCTKVSIILVALPMISRIIELAGDFLSR
ncbi:MAG: stage III sporulation AC/AD family protein [Clostridia bacterium]|nr:stage III sporulation AC/AD family protein [Clostridia bacterium]